MTYYRAAQGDRRCSHRHRTPRMAERCAELDRVEYLVECIGGRWDRELERRLEPSLRLLQGGG